MSMYAITINNSLVAVSEEMLTAMMNIRKLVADYLGVRNENCIDMGECIQYKPWADCAYALATYNNEAFKVYVTKVKTLEK